MLSDKEFAKVLNYLNKGNVFDRAKILRDTMHLVRDDGTSAYVEFINQKAWCQNQFQVTNQITVAGAYQNRYDVTLLINGLPLVQIELKRRGLELKEAFNQTSRYQRHSYDASHGLFKYIQIFVISNGVNTRYYANNRRQSFKQTFYWADKDNKNIKKLEAFTAAFLQTCHLAKMITKYTVLSETDKMLMILRPYQYYAVEAIIDHTKSSTKNGYIWHTTGSGKTLTAFKASQILVGMPDIYKIVFVVDRNDLDYKTIEDFNTYKEGSVDGTDNTKKLVKQFKDPDSKLIVTTIQKLNTAISHERHLLHMDKLKDEKIVFIFDECHRSQFGETHKRITDYFTNHQMFGFTGTPIFADNASGNSLGKRTTKDLFDECLHKYVITDAIADENVLKFSVEYYRGFKMKQGTMVDDLNVEGIDTQEVLEASARLEQNVDFIIANHNSKTHSRDFTAMFCVSSVDVLTKYYELFQTKKEAGKHNLRIATIFSYTANEDDKDANGMLDADIDITDKGPVNEHSRDKLESYITDYNGMFSTSYTTKDSTSFYNYYRNIAKRVKNREIDILLVVNMFLTGFDSKTLNTLYVDKNLRYHGLLQAYSRTNRILDERKSQGNIVVFRNLKKATDEAINLFSRKDAQEVIFIQPYEEYVKKFNEAVTNLSRLVATPEAVDDLIGEEQELAFVTAFRELMRIKNILVSFTEFVPADTLMNDQTFEDFKSKYLDIYDRVRSEHEKEKVSILDDIDFELELIRRDEINVDYILRLLGQLVDASDTQKDRIVQNIMDTMSTDAILRSKRELIQKFIEQSIPKVESSEAVENAFETFWSTEQADAFRKICEEEGLMTDRLQKLLENYVFTGRKPRQDDLAKALKDKPKIMERESIVAKISKRLSNFIDTFIEGV